MDLLDGVNRSRDLLSQRDVLRIGRGVEHELVHTDAAGVQRRNAHHIVLTHHIADNRNIVDGQQLHVFVGGRQCFGHGLDVVPEGL